MKFIKFTTSGLLTALLFGATVQPSFAQPERPTESSACTAFPVSQPCPF